MPDTFSNALYYPTIDIRNINWLKTAILFWDSISTIVPKSMEQPYTKPETQYLADIGFLRPLYVNPEDKSVVGIENDILDLLYSSEFLQLTRNNQDGNNFGRYILDGIYDEKMSNIIQNELKDFSRHFGERDVYCMGKDFTNIYMTILQANYVLIMDWVWLQMIHYALMLAI